MTAVDGLPTARASARRELPPSMVERVTLIMDLFEGRTARLTLEEVARCTSLPRSTAHRILDQLVRLCWLDHTALGYALGRRALGFGGGDGARTRVREAAAGRLHQLQIQTGLVVHLAVLDGAEVYYLDKAGGRFAEAVPSRVGGRAPAHSTALGKAMLAWLEPEEVEARAGEAIGRLTQRTICDVGTLHQELDRVRRRHGLAFERGECFPGIACVAAAVRGPDGPVAAISLVGGASAPLEKIAPLVVDAARQVSRELFPGGGTAAPASHRTTAEPEGAWSPQAMDRLLATGQYGDWQ
ncbi:MULTISPECIES: IclR family transcriptional regulator [Streptomyces]|uniref:Transcriptional regulator n=5 Tax=Streptomyces TaxID=1883 RepID=A0A8H9HMU8_9ACTN|nr:DNA-binding IclR family transcriptional regulator [Streptomyces sp. DSM 41037]NEC11244.1 IclR family transcriptional regulator [Streptomyces sp. SID8014]NEE30667.1 IclR family transcriptional regulator [Streptomyces sp. SID7982]NEE48770.1 IclR family transcriptional regulator [Streptomyces sp. SID8455]PJM81557.1 IclR family transcriptional regulator [Streptomyces sp. TSRI0384-2]QNE79824.1 helix-turn-helix domain-containing protein [Streptomyces rutgersensis]RPK82625.1 putative HTH-type tra